MEKYINYLIIFTKSISVTYGMSIAKNSKKFINYIVFNIKELILIIIN